MENPISTIKNSFSITTILKWFAVGIGVMALLDLLGVTDYFLYPVWSVKQALARNKAAKQ